MDISILSYFARGCLQDKVFDIPTWYRYLNGVTDASGRCSPQVDLRNNAQEAIVAIVLGVFEVLLFVAGIIAVGYIIWGAFQYMISQGEPDRAKGAKTTILNAIIGLVITMVSAGIVGFIGRSL
jgi:hypothetical protein